MASESVNHATSTCATIFWVRLWGPPASFIIGDPWQPSYGAKPVGYLEHRFHPDGTHDHRLVTVRGLVHNDLATMPEVYGDVTARGPGNG